MKSKSFNSDQNSAVTPVTLRQNRTFDFVNLYKSAAESSSSFSERHKSIDNHDTESFKFTSESPKREKSPNKRKKKEKRDSIDMSQINVDGPALNSSIGGALLNESKVTSTPLGHRKQHGKSSKVKSIMKSSSAIIDDGMDGSKLDTSTTKSKKRNKSVSFMLEDNDEVVIKKTKSDESSEKGSDSPSPNMKVNKLKKQFKNPKKNRLAEKENEIDVNQAMDNSAKDQAFKKFKTRSFKPKTLDTAAFEHTTESQSSQSENVTDIKKKHKKVKRAKKLADIEPKDSTASVIEGTSQELPEKTRKPKKKKRQQKPHADAENGEPASKSRKKDAKPDVVAELENLSIGVNPHTLTNLLDEMTVVDKEKRKKVKQNLHRNTQNTANTEGSEKTENGQEKVKWRRRKWNKDTKAEVKEAASIDTAVIVENLPLSLLFSYKKVLAEHFVKYGLIKSVGIAEVYPAVTKPVFTTTINFYSDGAATKALEEDKTTFEGNYIRVKRPLPATETTLVVRSYGALTAQCLSSTFTSAGRIRNIRHLVKGKHAMATFFIEFDGPEAVERAMKLATNIKIGGKKVYVSNFEVRNKKNKQGKVNENDGSDADQSEDSQD